jgi:hypothetical protein
MFVGAYQFHIHAVHGIGAGFWLFEYGIADMRMRDILRFGILGVVAFAELVMDGAIADKDVQASRGRQLILYISSRLLVLAAYLPYIFYKKQSVATSRNSYGFCFLGWVELIIGQRWRTLVIVTQSRGFCYRSLWQRKNASKGHCQ